MYKTVLGNTCVRIVLRRSSETVVLTYVIYLVISYDGYRKYVIIIKQVILYIDGKMNTIKIFYDVGNNILFFSQTFFNSDPNLNG